MEQYLRNYPDQLAASKIYNGFTFGFHLCYAGPIKSYHANNLKSANLCPDIVRGQINKEVQAGRVEGPFIKQPFTDFREERAR